MEPRDAGGGGAGNGGNGGASGGSSGGGGGGGGQANSSDFVRKLYKMLEDPSHKDVVRWSATGDSFIVVDTNLFTTKILPQHFKHSNFASFVRQLNKYDFHKIKNTEEGANPQYGEFKHPEFNKDSKDNLDNIRRKAPAARKNQQADEAGSAAIEMLQREISALREQTQLQEERIRKMESQQQIAMGEAHSVSVALTTHASYLKHHEEIIRKLLNIFGEIRSDLHQLKVRNGMEDHAQGTSPASGVDHGPGSQQNGSNSPLADARLLINNYEQEKNNMQSGNPDQFGQVPPYSLDGGYNSLDNNMGNMNGGMPNIGTSNQNPYAPGVNDMYNGAFPIPQPNGGSSGINTPAQRPMPGRKRSTPNAPDWRVSPRVLLVEDDPTCRRIGSKFLANAQCSVDIADDGLIAVNKMHRNKYDLVLMDIMMPNLDGCSAAHLIRQFDQQTPIIAMTSNIRREDINMYFIKGMNDVLPKPFTKDGLLSLLERMLTHLCKNPKQPQQIDYQAGSSSNSHEEEAKDGSQRGGYPGSSATPPIHPPGVYFGQGRSPANLQDDRTIAAQSSAPVAVNMGDNDGGYMGSVGQMGVGGYMEDGSGGPGGYQSPLPGGRRRPHEEMMGGPEGGHDMYPTIKKQRGY